MTPGRVIRRALWGSWWFGSIYNEQRCLHDTSISELNDVIVNLPNAKWSWQRKGGARMRGVEKTGRESAKEIKALVREQIDQNMTELWMSNHSKAKYKFRKPKKINLLARNISCSWSSYKKCHKIGFWMVWMVLDLVSITHGGGRHNTRGGLRFRTWWDYLSYPPWWHYRIIFWPGLSWLRCLQTSEYTDYY